MHRYGWQIQKYLGSRCIITIKSARNVYYIGNLKMACVRKDEITFEKTISNMVECKSCGVYLVELMMAGNYNIEESAGFTVYIPETDKHFATSLAVIPL